MLWFFIHVLTMLCSQHNYGITLSKTISKPTIRPKPACKRLATRPTHLSLQSARSRQPPVAPRSRRSAFSDLYEQGSAPAASLFGDLGASRPGLCWRLHDPRLMKRQRKRLECFTTLGRSHVARGTSPVCSLRPGTGRQVLGLKSRVWGPRSNHSAHCGAS